MILVNKMNKTFIKSEKIYDRKIESIKDFPLPKDYKNFISDIAKAFHVKNKRQICLKGITYYEDEIPINDQIDLEEFKNNIKYYSFFLEENDLNNLNKKQTGDKETDSDDEEIDLKFGIEINTEIVTDTTDNNEVNKFIDNSPEIKENLENDYKFDINNYIESLNQKNNNNLSLFEKIFESKVNNIVNDKSNVLKSKMNEIYGKYSESQLADFKEISEKMNDLNDEISSIIEVTGELNYHMEELRGKKEVEVK